MVLGLKENGKERETGEERWRDGEYLKEEEGRKGSGTHLFITAGIRLPENGSSVAWLCMADKISVHASSRPASVS